MVIQGGKKIRKWGGLAMALMLGAALCTLAARQPQTSLADADKLFEEKSYADALKGYEGALKAGTVPAARQDEVQYRIAVSLGKSKQWDRALEQTLDYVKTHKNSVWEPRALYWLGRLYLGVPHEGYKVGKTVHRGADVPKVEGSEKPERVYLAPQDAQNAHDALEAARVLFPVYRERFKTQDEEAQLDFDLARVLSESPDLYLWAQKQNWPAPADAQWKIDPNAAYSTEWPAPKRLLFLYAQIQALAPQTTDSAHNAALALFGKALWLKQYHNTMRSYSFKWENGKQINLPYPYQDEKGETALHQLVERFPEDSIRDQAQYTLITWQSQEQKFTDAVAEIRSFLTARPNSKWNEDARYLLEQITQKSLALNAYGFHPSGQQPKINVNFRNVKAIQFKLYHYKLEEGLQRAEAHNNPQVPLNDFTDQLGDLKEAQTHYGSLVSSWEMDTKDKDDYAYRYETITVPAQEAGAYVLEATAPGVKTGTVLLISDIALVQKIHRDGALLFAADAKTGAAIGNAKVVVKQFWYEAGTQHCAFSHGETGPEGLLAVPLLRAAGRSGFRVQAAAYTGSRYAMTENAYTYDYGSDNPNLVQVYSVTDRSVYRPQQRVYYRQMVMKHDRGEVKPVVNQAVHVEVFDSQGKQVYISDARTGEFGSVKGEFDLSSSVPLGEYTINVQLTGVENGPTQFGGNRFRVEEYKKPEFEVTVTPASDRVRLGDPTSAKVQASYYFGGPVPGAKVSYRVYRNYWAQSYRFPRPFDFLYQYDNNGDYNSNYRNGEVIAQGDTRTDAKGEATVSFPTKGEQSRWGNADLSYTVEADVQDESRRVISGTGAVKATKHDVAVFMNFPHGYATKGDRVDVEVITLNPSDKPVSVTGTAKVYRHPATPDAKETLVYQEPLKTDKQGRAIFKWNTNTSGYFRIAFETRDTAEQPVSGAIYVFVEGPELSQGKFLYQGLYLQTENLYYEEDQTAKVLLVTPAPNTTVLIIREANNEILGKQVVKVPGRSLELKVPLSRKDVPNVFMTAIAIRDGQMLQATQEVFVPPARQFTTVTVQADKAQYQPGEKAHLRLAAKDWQGKPVRTELSVSVSDASLGYIQKSYAPDIRAYYYGNRRTISNPIGGSFGTTYQPRYEDSQEHGKYNTHEWLLPEGMGQLLDWPGVERNSWYYLNGNSNYYFQRRSGGFGGGGFGGGGGRFADFDGAANGPAGVPMLGDMPMIGSLHSESKMDLQEDTKDKRQSKNKAGASGKKSEAGGFQEPTLRTRFEDTAFWTPAVVTDAKGTATVDVVWPDNLTQWRAVAVGNTTTAQVGSGETKIRTKKDLIVRLQAPRFFIERDLIVLSANVHNYLPNATRARVKLDLGDNTAEIVTGNSELTEAMEMNPRLADAGMNPRSMLTKSSFEDSNPNNSRTHGAVLTRAGGFGKRRPGIHPRVLELGVKSVDKPEVMIDLPKDGEKRVDWIIRVRHEGSLKIRMSARSPLAADATEMSFPVLVHGVERATAQNGLLREQNQTQVMLALPKERKPNSSELVVQLDPSLAVIMLDALPYLADYPYGCVEQTMSRFLPSVVVAKTLKESGYDLEALGKRAKLLEAREKAVPEKQKIENSPYTYPKGRPGVMQTAHLARTTAYRHNPVFDTVTLNSMVTEGLTRIQQFQHGDGGWGWWPGDTSDPYMTAYVLYGLQTAKNAGVKLDDGMIQRGLTWLQARFLEEDNFHRMAYEARTLAMSEPHRNPIRQLTTGRLYTNRERLSPYSKALLAMALHDLGDKEKANVLLRNIQTTAHVDEQNGTANWTNYDGYDGCWWRWYNNKVETNAAVLQAYMTIQPEAKLPPMMVKWLVNNRRANSWYSTRETAMAVYALADYARVTKELDPDYTLTVDLGGKVKRTYTVNHDNALFFDNQFVVPDELLQTGKQTLTLTKKGKGACYYGAYLRYFSLEEPIQKTGNEIFVTRRYFRLLPNTASGQPLGKPVDYKRPNPFLTGQYELLTSGGEWTGYVDTNGGPRYERVALKSGETVKSGDLLEVELQLESKNDYEYLAFEDLKPAGCEPVEVRSGFKAGSGVYSNMELRDQKVAFFISWMPQGTRTLSYRLRAEIPGEFHVLPTNGYAMYAPDIRALSEEMRLNVREGE